MLIDLLVGIPVMLVCLMLQSLFVAFCFRPYARYMKRTGGHGSLWQNTLLLSTVMLLMLLGNFVQMAIWGALFVLLGEFDRFAVALYHSGVNFATLGYGDIVMSEEWRLLGPLEAANGILMFGVSTAVMTAAVSDIIRHHLAQVRER
ncbi:ion channel [Metapseudomonas resinovorans]|uniref:Potassium channel domain-containing protein n=1 Tax=Metapseudomonas resinovorans NBRC 106553 TaxID=1245471 RepID=S6BM56_METRE|nr:ion channel [Pseudomonas resinovorans]BAN50334.1 hypothetical protein PCA10_46020 [Pseudomonas resinovorans NBRC 106553]